MKLDPAKCSECGSKRIWRASTFYRHVWRVFSRSQRRYCRDCGDKWGDAKEFDGEDFSFLNFAGEILALVFAISLALTAAYFMDLSFIKKHSVPAQAVKTK